MIVFGRASGLFECEVVSLGEEIRKSAQFREYHFAKFRKIPYHVKAVLFDSSFHRI